jgi:hypothetical protein
MFFKKYYNPVYLLWYQCQGEDMGQVQQRGGLGLLQTVFTIGFNVKVTIDVSDPFFPHS